MRRKLSIARCPTARPKCHVGVAKTYAVPLTMRHLQNFLPGQPNKMATGEALSRRCHRGISSTTGLIILCAAEWGATRR